MSDAWAVVIAAAIPVVASGIGVLIKIVLDMKQQQVAELRDLREENRTDHGIVMNAIIDLATDVKDIKRDQQDHFKWHATKDKPMARSRKS